MPWEAWFYVFCEALRPCEGRLYVFYVSQSLQVLRIGILEGWRPPSSIRSSLLEGWSLPHARHPHLEYRKCAQNHEFVIVFSRKQPKSMFFIFILTYMCSKPSIFSCYYQKTAKNIRNLRAQDWGARLLGGKLASIWVVGGNEGGGEHLQLDRRFVVSKNLRSTVGS